MDTNTAFLSWWEDMDNGCPTLVLNNDEDFAKAVWNAAIEYTTRTLRTKDTLWWGYLHADGSIQLKRWFGDHKDYTDDCEGNDFVVQVVRPFAAGNYPEACYKLNTLLNQ